MNLRRQRRRIYSPLRLTRLRYPSIGTLKGIRTPVARMKTWYPGPLDDEGIKWSGCSDLNRGPPAPKAGALPNCATARFHEYNYTGYT